MKYTITFGGIYAEGRWHFGDFHQVLRDAIRRFTALSWDDVKEEVFRARLWWNVEGDKPMVSYGVILGDGSEKRVRGRTGRVLSRHLPNLSDEELQKIAEAVNEANPIFKGWEEPEVLPFARGALSTEDALGSCMYVRPDFWRNLEDEALHPAPDALPEDPDDWPDGTGPAALVWRRVPATISEGAGELRAFLWPVILGSEGRKAWYLDRMYPACPESREFAKEFADKHGFLCHANDDHEDLSFAHPLRGVTSFDGDGWPYLDSFRHPNKAGDALVTADHEDRDERFDTQGDYEHGDWCVGPICCACGNLETDDTHHEHCYTGEVFCNSCYHERFDTCEKCGTEFLTEPLCVGGYAYCDAGCAEDDGWVRCIECGEWSDEDQTSHSGYEEGQVCHECQEYHGYHKCAYCGDVEKRDINHIQDEDEWVCKGCLPSDAKRCEECGDVWLQHHDLCEACAEKADEATEEVSA